MKSIAQKYTLLSSDAKLGVACYGLEQAEIKEKLEQVNSALSQNNDFTIHLKMDYAICMLDENEKSVSEALTHAASILKTRKLLDEESIHSATIDSLRQMLIECDPETESHVRRTRILGDSLAYDIGLSDYERDQLSLLCLFHDIGKVGIPPQILNKPGPLTEEEWTIMREHVQKGYRIARATAGLEIVAEPILHHHENWDGNGYPDGLQAEAIPILSRIISVIDAYDAMVSDRPYREGMSKEDACAELERCAGTQFDPYIVDAFVRMIKEKPASEGKPVLVNAIEARQAGVHPSLEVGFENEVLASKTAMINPVLYSRYELDESGHIVELDDAFENLTGYTSYDVEHLNLTQNDLLFEEDRDLYSELVDETVSAYGNVYLEHRIRCKDGTGRYVYCLRTKLANMPDAHSLIFVTDITDSISIQHQVGLARNRAMMSLRRLEETVRLDPMTGLLNKSAFRKACERELLDETQICVLMMIDLDNFKHFNDTYGHPKGDELLIAFARALEEAVGGDGYTGRVGGDEFCCMLRFKKDTTLIEISERTQRVWKETDARLDELAYIASLSAGVVYATPANSDYTTLYRLADEALYAAKDAGKNQIYLAWEH